MKNTILRMTIGGVKLIFLGFVISVVASGAARDKIHDKGKLSCSPQERALKTCKLRSGSFAIQVEPTKLLLNDGVFRHVAESPGFASTSEWEEIHLSKLKDEWILEFFLWQKNKDHEPLEELHWIVAQIKESQVGYRLDEVIQRRSPKEDSTHKVKIFNYDPKLSTSLRVIGEEIEWRAGGRTGILSNSTTKSE